MSLVDRNAVPDQGFVTREKHDPKQITHVRPTVRILVALGTQILRFAE